jgi:hypothetical protein
MTKRPSELRDEWNALKQEAADLAAKGEALRDLPAHASEVQAHEARIGMLAVQQELLACAAWVGEARDLADVLLLAEVAWELWWGLGTFPELPADIEDKEQRVVAVAYLVKGVWDAVQAQGGATP